MQTFGTFEVCYSSCLCEWEVARKNEESLKVNRDIIDITKMGVQPLLTIKGGRGVALALLVPSPHFVMNFVVVVPVLSFPWGDCKGD